MRYIIVTILSLLLLLSAYMGIMLFSRAIFQYHHVSKDAVVAIKQRSSATMGHPFEREYLFELRWKATPKLEAPSFEESELDRALLEVMESQTPGREIFPSVNLSKEKIEEKLRAEKDSIKEAAMELRESRIWSLASNDEELPQGSLSAFCPSLLKFRWWMAAPLWRGAQLFYDKRPQEGREQLQGALNLSRLFIRKGETLEHLLLGASSLYQFCDIMRILLRDEALDQDSSQKLASSIEELERRDFSRAIELEHERNQRFLEILAKRRPWGWTFQRYFIGDPRSELDRIYSRLKESMQSESGREEFREYLFERQREHKEFIIAHMLVPAWGMVHKRLDKGGEELKRVKAALEKI